MQADAETLWAVVIGALLATIGGFASSQLEAYLRRRERERSAALLFGELLTMMRIIMGLAKETRGRGDPYGPVTMRFLRAAKRETEIYDRNRETLFELRDASVRAQIHTLVARITFSLDGVADVTSEIASTQRAVAALSPDDTARVEAEARLQAMLQDRNAAFDFAVEATQDIESILAVLTPLARHAFDAHDAVVQNQQARQAQQVSAPTEASASET